jgi:hypothetical protein
VDSELAALKAQIAAPATPELTAGT